MTVLWTPYNASPAAITWRQSRIEPSRVAPRRLTGLRTTVARFRLPASAGMPTARPPTGGPRPAVGAGRRWTRTARQGARSPVPPCQSARARRPAIIRTAFRAIVCRRVPGPAARPVRRPTARDLICEDPWPGRRRVSTRVVAVHSHTGSRAAEFVRTPYTVLAYGPSQIRTRHYECKVARGGRRGRAGRRGFGDRT